MKPLPLSPSRPTRKKTVSAVNKRNDCQKKKLQENEEEEPSEKPRNCRECYRSLNKEAKNECVCRRNGCKRKAILPSPTITATVVKSEPSSSSAAKRLKKKAYGKHVTIPTPSTVRFTIQPKRTDNNYCKKLRGNDHSKDSKKEAVKCKKRKRSSLSETLDSLQIQIPTCPSPDLPIIPIPSPAHSYSSSTPPTATLILESSVNLDAISTIPEIPSVDPAFEKNKYQRLMLSLQCPLPNEHQFALEACMVLSSIEEGRKPNKNKLNVIENTPALLNTLLAHAGFYSDCGLRAIIEETCKDGFTGELLGDAEKCFDFAVFWERLCGVGPTNHQMSQLLCECFPGKLPELSETDMQIMRGMAMVDPSVMKCCEGCRAKFPPKQDNDSKELDYTSTLPMIQTSDSSLAIEKIETRIELVGEILRNFSFDKGNAGVMAKNPTLLRFLLITAQQTHYRSLTEISYDIISNILNSSVVSTDVPTSSSFSFQKEQVLSKSKSMLTDLVLSTFLESSDRFIILRTMDAISGLVKSEDVRTQLNADQRQRLLERLFQFVTLKTDAELVTNCLECILSISEVGAKTCNEIIDIPGALNTLVSCITVNNLRGLIATKQIRLTKKSANLTALLIIRNIVNQSSQARRSLKRYESHFLKLASMDHNDCSWVAAEVLYHLAEYDGAVSEFNLALTTN